MRLGRWIRAAARPDDDAGSIRAKRQLAFAGALFGELSARHGREEALRIVRPLLEEVAVDAQQKAYGPARSWDAFHAAHHAAMTSGFADVNVHDRPEVTADRVSFHIVRCRLHEALRDMGAPELTLAFCCSDETVFPTLVDGMSFDRGGDRPDTIARGAPRCGFVFRRTPPRSPDGCTRGR